MPPGLKELMLFYVRDYHFIANAFRKTHYHKIEKSHQISPPTWRELSDANNSHAYGQQLRSARGGLKIKIKVMRHWRDLRNCRPT